MADAHLPAVRSSTKLGTRAEKIVKLLIKGWTAQEIAEKLAPDKPKKQKTIRRQILRLASQNMDYIQAQAEVSKGELLEVLPDVSAAVGKRGKRGRIDASKLIYETTGFHNPKVQHEHSGDITISLKGVPRPQTVETVDSTVEDAEVVE